MCRANCGELIAQMNKKAAAARRRPSWEQMFPLCRKMDEYLNQLSPFINQRISLAAIYAAQDTNFKPKQIQGWRTKFRENKINYQKTGIRYFFMKLIG